MFEQILNNANQKWNELNSSSNIWIRIGYGASGQAAGADDVFNEFNKLANDNKNVSVSFVGSMGLSYAEPLVDFTYSDGLRIFYNNVDKEKAKLIYDSHVNNNQINNDLVFGQIAPNNSQPISGVPQIDKEKPLSLTKRIATENCGNISPTDINQYIANGGYEALNRALNDLDPEKTLNMVKDSGLRGRGGAAFSTGVKWSFLANNSSDRKYVLVNCEEGDPGAFNDKGILENDPHMLLEGLILCGYATGSSNGHIFIRDGHEIPIENSRKAIQQAYDLNLLGNNILGTGFSFDVEVSLTGDSYVAGEETALMEAIEGKRSMPRFKPPFPAVSGLWGKPSNINNVKTLSYVPFIVKNGSESYKNIGSETSSGTAIVCLSGHIKRPGMYEIEMGMTINDLLLNIGGGFPSRYRGGVPDLNEICHEITKALYLHFGSSVPRIIAEPGRYIAGDAGVIEAEVVLVSQKRHGGRRWVYVDIGKFGGLIETMGEAIRYKIETTRDGGATGPVVLAGPTCDEMDVLYDFSGYQLPLDLQEGDKIRFLSAGPSTESYSSTGFNGFPPLREYYI